MYRARQDKLIHKRRMFLPVKQGFDIDVVVEYTEPAISRGTIQRSTNMCVWRTVRHRRKHRLQGMHRSIMQRFHGMLRRERMLLKPEQTMRMKRPLRLLRQQVRLCSPA